MSSFSTRISSGGWSPVAAASRLQTRAPVCFTCRWAAAGPSHPSPCQGPARAAPPLHVSTPTLAPGVRAAIWSPAPRARRLASWQVVLRLAGGVGSCGPAPTAPGRPHCRASLPAKRLAAGARGPVPSAAVPAICFIIKSSSWQTGPSPGTVITVNLSSDLNVSSSAAPPATARSSTTAWLPHPTSLHFPPMWEEGDGGRSGSVGGAVGAE